MYYELSFKNINEFFYLIEEKSKENGWNVLVSDIDASKNQKLYLKNTDNNCCVFFDYTFNENDKDYKKNLYVNVSSDYDNTKPINDQPNNASYRKNFKIYDNLLTKMFLSITPNRILFFNRHKNFYNMLYIGKYLQYATPIQNLYPFCVFGGAINEFTTTSVSSYNFFGDLDFLYKEQQLTNDVIFYPYFSSSSSFNLLQEIYKNDDGSNTVFDIEVFSKKSGFKGVLGAIDGLKAITNNSITNESLFTVDNKDFIILPISSNKDIYIAMEKK